MKFRDYANALLDKIDEAEKEQNIEEAKRLLIVLSSVCYDMLDRLSKHESKK